MACRNGSAREIVEAAVRRGAFSAVSLRMPWIQVPETFLRQRRSAAGRAPTPPRDLWSYLDARAMRRTPSSWRCGAADRRASAASS